MKIQEIFDKRERDAPATCATSSVPDRSLCAASALTSVVIANDDAVVALSAPPSSSARSRFASTITLGANSRDAALNSSSNVDDDDNIDLFNGFVVIKGNDVVAVVAAVVVVVVVNVVVVAARFAVLAFVASFTASASTRTTCMRATLLRAMCAKTRSISALAAATRKRVRHDMTQVKSKQKCTFTF